MKIKRLRIDDFGIIRNQTIEDISSNMVVIGGPNRSGKTTFKKLLKCLGYGFKGQSNLPSPNNKYRVEGDFMLETGDKFQLLIEGHSEPKVSCLQGDFSRVKGSTCLYNNLDMFTYQQLFTISLEELKRLPDNLDKKEEDKLQSVLLGAGLKDIIQISPVEKKLRKEAEKIGGKNGSPNVKEFKPFYNQIKAGLELRDRAKSQVNMYYQKLNEKKELDDQIKEIQDRLDDQSLISTRLEVLEHWYTDYQKLTDLENSLNAPDIKNLLQEECYISLEKIDQFIEEYQNLSNDIETAYEAFVNKITQNYLDKGKLEKEKIVSAVKKSLITNYNQIDMYYRQASGLRERLQRYREEKAEIQNTEYNLKIEANKVSDGLGDSLDKITNMKLDNLNKDALIRCIEEYLELSRQKNQVLEDKKSFEEELNHLNSQLAKIRTPESISYLNKYFMFSLIFVIVGGITGLVNILLGTLIGSAGIIGAGLYILIKHQNTSHERLRKDDLMFQIDKTQKQLEIEIEKEKELVEEIKDLENKIEWYKQNIGLNKNIAVEMIKEHLHQVITLNEKVENLKSLKINFEQKKINLVNEFEKLYTLIDEIYTKMYQTTSLQNEISKEEVLTKGENLLIKLEQLLELSKEALEIKRLEQRKKDLEEKMISELNLNEISGTKSILSTLKTLKDRITKQEKYRQLEEELSILKSQLVSFLKMDRVKEAFGIEEDHLVQNEELIKRFRNYWKEYAIVKEIKESKKENERKIAELKERLDKAKDNTKQLELELKDLATDENIQKSQAKIDSARKDLRPLAEKYAVNKVAAFLLKEAKSKFLKKAKEDLLKEANVYFEKITDGDYKGIMPVPDLMNSDFHIESKNGEIVQTTDVLSRGTKEQLFLSVRLSRIKEITPPLPVILDDTLTNFDMYHLGRTVSLLTELSKTHQIFILTCHPELVKAILDYSQSAQFFSLKNGVFSPTKGEELITNLNRR
ncbi:ATP-binding protein [Natranaerofaba carboxydovora]|uniref:ATP-binding protein n=1 Tax=Natranaerofaba carboxydovora TaxID=2742683 RepID=UPI001F12D14B|nr:AAA family ATPase [Natranaerofaba carboxydovora]UMZ73670.1 AAA domain protein [Natranaerofaba carboxydovora]